MKTFWLIFVLLMPVTAAFAQEQPAVDQNPRVIEVEGHGEAGARPDRALMSFPIEAKEVTAEEAQAQLAQISDKVIADLKAKVGAGGKVEVAATSLSPIRSTAASDAFRISTWWARYQIAVDCDPSEAGAVLDAANDMGIGGSSDTRQNYEKAMVNLYVTGTALTADDALKRVAERVNQVVDKIKPKLGPNSTIKIYTSSVHSEKELGSQTQKVIGYKASNSISVETGTIDQVGSLIDLATADGASGTTGVTFKLRDDSKARSEAVANACKDAQFKANAAAQALGLKIKRIVKVSTVNDATPPPDDQIGEEVAAAASQNPTMPLKPDDLIVQASVTVTYELE